MQERGGGENNKVKTQLMYVDQEVAYLLELADKDIKISIIMVLKNFLEKVSTIGEEMGFLGNKWKL